MKSAFYSKKSKNEMMEIIVSMFNEERAESEKDPTSEYQLGRKHVISDMIRKLEIFDRADLDG